MIKIAPSLLSADFANMGEATRKLGEWNADLVHFDVMDGTFVPTITFGPAMCAAIRPYTELPIDVHIMVEHPETYIDQFAKAGADYLTFHAEVDAHAHRTLQAIRRAGMKAGVAINPGTPVEMVQYLLSICDLVLVMSVNPGFGGQSFIPSSLDKIREVKKLIDDRELNVDIEVDGGVKLGNLKEVLAAGANVIVAGSAIFKGDITKNVEDFLEVFKDCEVEG